MPPSISERRTKDEDAASAAACVAIAVGTKAESGVSTSARLGRESATVGASAAARAADGRVLTWGAPGLWLGRGVGNEWAPGNEPAPLRFEEPRGDAGDDGGATPRVAPVG